MAIPNISSSQKTIGRWLLGLSGMTFGAVVLGGVTSYVAEHGDMALSRFKFIWYMEYIHRMWGRAIGVLFAAPATYFLYKGYFSRSMKPRVFIYGVLIGIQGLFGWLMVRSGLGNYRKPAGLKPDEDFKGVPRVDHYWLCTHLCSAVILYSLFIWGSFEHLAHHSPVKPFAALKQLKILGHTSKAMTFLTLIFGGLVAGLDAGLVYNSWPKMADKWIPDDLVIPRYGSTTRNLLENPVGVQFSHRMLAYLSIGTVGLLWATVMKAGVARTGPRIRMAAHMALGAVLGQSALGVLTLLHYVPVTLGALHQGGSLVLFTTLLWFTHCLRAVPK